MRLLLVTLLGLVSCGRTDQDPHPSQAGAGGVPTGDAGGAGGRGVAVAANAGSANTAGMAVAVGGSASAGTAGDGASAGVGGTLSAGAAGDGAGGEGGTIDLTDYACEAYSLGQCLDGSASQSYACCPLVGDAPCLTGFRASNGADFRCGNASCYCEEQAFYESCYGNGSPCREPPDCKTVWQHQHVYQGEHPGAGFNDYSSQISLDSHGCGTIGIGLDNHRVGTFIVNGLDDCWRRGTTVTSQMLIGIESGTFELETSPQTTPPFQAFAGRLELDIYQVSWDTDSLSFDVTWRAVACQ